ncbi:DUF2520 domain-containing protein, partial [bacterium]|nr:DUF2520 domain-containing protein [bacterium]
FCIEAGTEAGIKMASEISSQLGASVVELSGESKVAHHLACVIASNFLVVLLNEAHSIHEAAGVPGDVGLDMLTHLAKAAAQNVRSQGPKAALTGPFARGDISSIEAHIEWMSKCSPALLDLYTTLGRRAIQLALAANQISQDAALKMLDLLKV